MFLTKPRNPTPLLSKLWHDIAKLKRLPTQQEKASPGWDELYRRLLPRLYAKTIEWAKAGCHDLEAKPFANVDKNSSLEETAIAYLYGYQKKCHQKMEADEGFVQRQIDIILKDSSNPAFDTGRITVAINHLELLGKVASLKAARPMFYEDAIFNACNFGLELKLAQYLNTGPMRMGIPSESHAESKLGNSIFLAYTGWSPTLPDAAAAILSSKESGQYPAYYTRSDLLEMVLPKVYEFDAFLYSISPERYAEFTSPLNQPEEKVAGGADAETEHFRHAYEAFREKAYFILSDAEGRREFEEKIASLSKEDMTELSAEQIKTLFRGFTTIAVAVGEEYLKKGEAGQASPILNFFTTLINTHIDSQRSGYIYPLMKLIPSIPKEVRQAVLLAPNVYKETALHLAANEGDAATTSTLLEVADDDTKRDMLLATDIHGNTALHNAAYCNRLGIAIALLRAADDHTKRDMLIATDMHGDTALHNTVWSISRKHSTIVSALLEIADDDTKHEMLLAKNDQGKTPLYLAAYSKEKDIIFTLLEAVPDAATVSALLAAVPDVADRCEIQLVVDYYCKTALHLAAARGNITIVSALLQARHNIGLPPVNYWNYYFGLYGRESNATFEAYFSEKKLTACDKFAMIHRSKRGALFFALPAAVVGVAGAVTIQAVAVKSIALALTLPVCIYGALVGIAGLLLLSFVVDRLRSCTERNIDPTLNFSYAPLINR